MILFETSNWSVEYIFNHPLENFRLAVAGETVRPEGAEKMEIALWNDAVLKKKKVLEDAGLTTQLSEQGFRHSLLAKKPEQEKFGPAMVPGTQYRLVRVNGDTLVVEPVVFSELFALQDRGFRELYEKAGLVLPHGPLAVVVYIQTGWHMDTRSILLGTVRGKGTPKYPGGIWGVGGDLDTPVITLEEFLVTRELREELVVPGGVTDYTAIGLMFDKVLRKHDLVVWARTASPFEEIRKGEVYLADVDSITALPTGKVRLASFLVHHFFPTADPNDPQWVGRPTAACSGGLFAYGAMTYGEEWAKDVLPYLTA